MPQNLQEWIDSRLNQGHLGSSSGRDEADLEQLKQTMSRIAQLLGTDLDGLEVHGVAGRLRPLVGFTSPRLDLRLYQNPNDSFIVSIKILDGKPPAGPPLTKLIEHFSVSADTPVIAMLMPHSWCFLRRGDPAGALAFTEWLPDMYWLHTFFYVLIRELDQY